MYRVLARDLSLRGHHTHETGRCRGEAPLETPRGGPLGAGVCPCSLLGATTRTYAKGVIKNYALV